MGLPLARLRAIFFPPRRPLRWLLPMAALVALVLLQLLHPTWAGRLEAWTVDARFRLRGPEPPRFPIVIVAADEDSFQMLGDLAGENVRTWPRARWAELVERIAAGHPRAIVLDAVFDTPGWDEGGDTALAAALAAAGNVVLPANLQQQGISGSGLLTYSPPIEALSQAAWGVGVATFASDADGAVRRLPLIYPWGGQAYPSLALAAAVCYSGAPVEVPPADLADDLTLPIHYRGPEGTFATIPLYQVMKGESDPRAFDGAIVLVGYTTQLEQDRHPAPFAGRQRMPGVEILANGLDTLLAGDWLHRAPAWLAPLLVGLLGLLALAALNLRRPALGIAATAAALLLYLLAAAIAFARADLLWPIVAPAAGALGVGGVALAERLVGAEGEKRTMRQRFAGVMSAERLRAVMDHWDDLRRPERRLREAAVLFADIRGFTHATETLMAQGRTAEMVSFLTAYLDAMSAAVFAEGGVIYRMLGDGLLILFGLPDPLPDHAVAAVRGALRMAHAADRLAARWPLREEAPFGMGIGINAGRMADGIVGSGRQLDYAVIGDSVNTAARIESHCKSAMAIPRPAGGTVPERVTILLGADLYAQVRDQVLADEAIPPFPARGKAEPLQVVRLLGLRDGSL